MAKKIKKYKVGLDSETYKISMVSEPAIEVDYVALAKQDDIEVKLSSDERHICYGPALIPNKDIYRNNGEQEFYINFTEESIIKMSQEFMKNYKQHEVSLQHEENVDEVYVAESWIVEDPYRDKANALGFNVPKNTWMVGMKVNNIDTWERVKSGELKGFSVESAIHLEEFNKISNDMEVNEDTFWTKLKSVLAEAFGKEKEEKVEPNVIESTNVELEEETIENNPPVEPQEPPKVEEPTPVKEEPKQEPVEPKEEPKEEPKQDNHLEELINNLKDEIAALKEMNSGLQDKIKDLGKQPSAKPVNTNAKPSGSATGTTSSSYQAWREQMAQYLR